MQALQHRAALALFLFAELHFFGLLSIRSGYDRLFDFDLHGERRLRRGRCRRLIAAGLRARLVPPDGVRVGDLEFRSRDRRMSDYVIGFLA